MELRSSLQQSEAKLLEVAGAPLNKRKDLVYQHLVGKEEQLAEARRESAFLLGELQVLQTLQRDHPRRPGPASSAPLSSEAPGRVSKVEELRRAQFAANNMHNFAPSSGGAGSASSVVMTKDIARQVVLNEVKRLQESLSSAKQTAQQLVQKVLWLLL